MSTQPLSINGRQYTVPAHTTVVCTVDGGDPEYFNDALERGIMPNLAGMLENGGHYGVGTCQVPTLTNPNNLSIVTGAPASIHGIPGNYMRLPDGTYELLNDPKYLRAPSIHAEFARLGIPVLCVTAKDKLRRLLGNDGVPSVSVENAAGMGIPEFGIADIETAVGEPAPGVYEPLASHYAMRIGLAALKSEKPPRLLYVSLTDRVQHAAAPGSELSDLFFTHFDDLLGKYLEHGCVVGITADHGMSKKHDNDGAPRVHFLLDELETAGILERDGAEVVLPITDPYVKHHGALGSFAWVYLPDCGSGTLDRARSALAALDGVEEVWTGQEAAVLYQLPKDRVGDLAVLSSGSVALGRRAEDHDLSQLHGALRSHGGRHEQFVPLMTSHSLDEDSIQRLEGGMLKNLDIHDLLLNRLVKIEDYGRKLPDEAMVETIAVG